MVLDHGRGQKLVVEEALYAYSDDTYTLTRNGD